MPAARGRGTPYPAPSAPLLPPLAATPGQCQVLIHRQSPTASTPLPSSPSMPPACELDLLVRAESLLLSSGTRALPSLTARSAQAGQGVSGREEFPGCDSLPVCAFLTSDGSLRPQDKSARPPPPTATGHLLRRRTPGISAAPVTGPGRTAQGSSGLLTTPAQASAQRCNDSCSIATAPGAALFAHGLD